MEAFYKANHIRIYNEDCRFMKELGDESVDLIATDPPYGISFMGKDWDTFNELVEPQGAYQKKKGFKKLPRQNTISMTEFFIPIWKECLRILKLGAFAFVMCSPRADVMAKQVSCLQEAGFLVNFTPIYHAYAQGFPKAQNIGKAVDKKAYKVKYSLNELQDKLNERRKAKGLTLKRINELLGAPPNSGLAAHKFCDKSQPQFPTREQMVILDEVLELGGELWLLYDKVEREIIGSKKAGLGSGETYAFANNKEAPKEVNITLPYLDQAKALDGSYGGFQPKPAVEVIIVAMKPLSEKTFVNQALKNQKGITWLDDCRIPYESQYDKSQATPQGRCTGQVYDSMLGRERKEFDRPEQKGRFPANLLVSDDVLNVESKSVGHYSYQLKKSPYDGGWKSLEDKGNLKETNHSFSRYFDLEKWWEEKIKGLPESVQRTFPFLIVPKASKSEKNKGLETMPEVVKSGLPLRDGSGDYVLNEYGDSSMSTRNTKTRNYHPTVKPIKLMSYLITLGSREGDTVVDPFIGTGSTAIACQILGRKCTGYEINANYCEIAKSRLTYYCQKAMNLEPITALLRRS